MDKTKVQPDRLENLLKTLHSAKTAPMTKEEIDLFMFISLVDKNKIDDMFEDVKQKSWVLEALEKRVEASLTITIEKSVLVFILFLVDNNIGKGITYLYYLQYWGKINSIKNITWDLIGLRIFPFRFFKEEDIETFWDSQKINTKRGSDNMINYKECSVSIMDIN